MSLLRLFALPLLIAAAACSGDDSLSPPSIYGTYDLQTVNANPLPTLLLQQGDYTFKATGGFYTLRDNGTFNSAQTWREDYQGWSHVSTHSFDGTFSMNADTAIFVWPSDGSTWRGILQNGQLSIVDDGHTWVFRK